MLARFWLVKLNDLYAFRAFRELRLQIVMVHSGDNLTFTRLRERTKWEETVA